MYITTILFERGNKMEYSVENIVKKLKKSTTKEILEQFSSKMFKADEEKNQMIDQLLEKLALSGYSKENSKFVYTTVEIIQILANEIDFLKGIISTLVQNAHSH